MRWNRKILWILLCLFRFLSMPVFAAGECRVPILMYHHFSTDGTASADVCPIEQFREHMEALWCAGAETLDFADLYRFVKTGDPLPERCVVLTADDGYESVLTLAAPVLRSYGYVMSVAVIGSRMGEREEIPHFSFSRYDTDAGDCIRLISHGWDIHRQTEWERGVLTAEGTVVPRFVQDMVRMRSLSAGYPGLGQVFVYPYGCCSGDSEALLEMFGYIVTVTVSPGIARLKQGDMECLRMLPRMGIDGKLTGEDLLKILGWETDTAHQ